MNKAYAIIAFVMLALFAVSASALSVSDVQFGDSTQERVFNLTKSVTITNNGPDTVSNVQLTFNSDALYQLTAVSVTGFTTGSALGSNTLASGASATVTVQAFVPNKFDSVDSNLDEKAFSIGTMTVVGTNTTNQQQTNSSAISMQAKNKLTVSDMTIYVNGESQTVSNNERIENLKPGDKLRFEIVAKNQYSDRSNIDVAMDNALVTIRSTNSELDVDDEDDLGTISPKSDDTATFDYTIPDDINDGTYTVDVKVVGTDDFGGKHGEKTTIRLKVEREPHSIAIRKALVQPTTIVCDDTSRIATVDVNVNNMGQRNENEVVIEADAPQLKFNKKVADIKLAKGKSKTQQFAVTVSDDVKPGTYRVDVNTYYANNVKSESKTLTLKVDGCEVPEDKTTTVVAPPVTLPPATVTLPATTVTPPKARVSTTDSFTDSDLYVYLLAGLSGVLLLILLVVVIVAMSRRRHEDD